MHFRSFDMLELAHLVTHRKEQVGQKCNGESEDRLGCGANSDFIIEGKHVLFFLI